ncbi:MAG: hypothetical protein IRZ33_01605 [Alicyclobacillaceae bacterium]|nr:hypothetical protein [Alicyclobacillaceae bacterium]
MTPFWNWFWHSIAFILALLIGLPSFMIRRMVHRFSLHKPIAPGDVRSVRVDGRSLQPAEAQQVLAWFNESVFLLRHWGPSGAVPSDGPTLRMELAGSREVRVFAGTKECEVVRTDGKQSVAYQVHAPSLWSWLRMQQAGEPRDGASAEVTRAVASPYGDKEGLR